MVDFRKLRESKAKPLAKHPREIFNSLPKPPGINDLYASQAEVLDAWHPRRNERDVVVKLHTGGGKTLVALLMAQSIMNEFGEPVVYLAPTNQLVQQVLAKSKEYGVYAAPYIKGQDLPPDFFDGKCVLVGAYETMFNGRSKFGVRNAVPNSVNVGAIILDDAHAALSSVRDAFTLTIKASDHKEIYKELASWFRPAFAEVSRAGTFSDITKDNDYGVIEVPSWAWHRKVPELHDYLSQIVGSVNPFVWPFLRDNLATCHCLFSRGSVSITPIFPLVDLLPTFEDCPRRIYMSATISDDSEIIRTFGVSVDAVSTPITSASLAGVAERMIIVPELTKVHGTPITPMVKDIVSSVIAKESGAAILAPSGKVAKVWTDIAVHPETSVDVSAQIAAMQAGTTFGPVVLANRYDGIDLAGNSCRLLVLDGLPQGSSDYDVFRTHVIADSAMNSLLAQRIEQGIGRGARGGSDYCVVLLIGSKLVGWIGRKSNLGQLTASTRVQLKIGQEVSEAVSSVKEVKETVFKCLDRDPDWVAYHASELADAAHGMPIDHLALRIAGVERKAFKHQRLGHFEEGIQKLEALIASPELATERRRRAWLYALCARLAFQLGDGFTGRPKASIGGTGPKKGLVNSSSSPTRASV